MRLYDEAIPYYQTAIDYCKILQDSIGIFLLNSSLGNAYLHKEDFKNAKIHYNNAAKIASALKNEAMLARIDMHMAAIELGENNIPTALNLIRTVPNKIQKGDYEVAIGYAADIYLQAGIVDTAYFYANELKNIKGNSQKLGYQILLEDLTDQIEPDSIVPYVKTYTEIMEGFVRKNTDEAALLQHTVYNYSVIEKERDKANQKNKTLRWMIFGLVLTSVAFFILALFLYFSNKKRKALSLALSKENNNLNQALYKNKSVNIKNSDSTTQNYNSPVENRDRLRQLIKDSINKFEPMPDIQKIITDSALYKEFLAMSKNNVAVPDKSPKWHELEKLVLSAYPDFLDRINILSLGKYTTTEYHYILLTKCGFGPKATSVLMHIIPSGITYRKNKVLKILFENIIDAEDFYTAIALL